MQSVIVYRNPAEAAFWEMWMNSSAGAWVWCFVVALVATAVVRWLSAALWDMVPPRWTERVGKTRHQQRTIQRALTSVVVGAASGWIFVMMVRNAGLL